MRFRGRRLLLASLVLWGLGFADLEESFIHTDDGCVVETHCNACLLRLGTASVGAAIRFTLPPILSRPEPAIPAAAPSYEDAAPPALATRGPPLA
jgi:hypothetical protein